MWQSINSLKEYNELVENEPAILFYFSTDECNVCKVLKPKIAKLASELFPQLKLAYVNLNQSPEVAAQNRIFAVPTIQVIFDKREYIRKSRSLGLEELKEAIDRPYRMMFV